MAKIVTLMIKCEQFPTNGMKRSFPTLNSAQWTFQTLYFLVPILSLVLSRLSSFLDRVNYIDTLTQHFIWFLKCILSYACEFCKLTNLWLRFVCSFFFLFHWQLISHLCCSRCVFGMNFNLQLPLFVGFALRSQAFKVPCTDHLIYALSVFLLWIYGWCARTFVLKLFLLLFVVVFFVVMLSFVKNGWSAIRCMWATANFGGKLWMNLIYILDTLDCIKIKDAKRKWMKNKIK